MAADHPNEPGRWTKLDGQGGTVLWRRERSDPYPVTMYYLVSQTRQTEVLYNEEHARARYVELVNGKVGDRIVK